QVCLPFVPASSSQMTNVLQMLKGKTGKLVDLGSGDGRIVIEAAKRGFHAEGIELNPWLVAFSRFNALRSGVASKTGFYRRDLWKADLSTYDYIVIFGVETMMEPLETKLAREITATNHVLACRYPLPRWTPSEVIGEGIDSVWLYTKDSKVS
ncbi:hypothetical protein CAPTEDRAFT_107213, partial [Capitella teleta]